MRGRTGERSRRRGARQACAIRDLLEVRGFILSAPPARLFGLGAFSYEPPPGAARLRFGSRPGACVIKRAFCGTHPHAADQRRAGRFGVLFTRLINQCTIFSMEHEENGTKDGRAVGYARVSTTEQDLQMQLDALHKAGVTPARLFVDKASGAAADRPGLGKCLEFLQAGDLLLVWRLDRLGRSMVHLVGLVRIGLQVPKGTL